MTKRVQFFLVAAVACGLLAPVAETEVRFVPITLAVVYVVLALLSALDDRSQR